MILKYSAGGFNTLHQDLYGEIYFPLQAACFLNEPDKDYTGGEFVLTEQVPRAQSKASVKAAARGYDYLHHEFLTGQGHARLLSSPYAPWR